MASWLAVQAKLCTVRTTRVRLVWAVLMTLVSLELVQPLQPTVVVPSLFFLTRAPVELAPTPKYAMVESFAQSSRVEVSDNSQYGRNPKISRRRPPELTAASGSTD